MYCYSVLGLCSDLSPVFIDAPSADYLDRQSGRSGPCKSGRSGLHHSERAQFYHLYLDELEKLVINLRNQLSH